MDTVWAQRQAYVPFPQGFPCLRTCSYDKARQIKEAQDEFCAKAEAGHWDDLGKFPEDLQWEALVDVLRGRVKVRAEHCIMVSL